MGITMDRSCLIQKMIPEWLEMEKELSIYSDLRNNAFYKKAKEKKIYLIHQYEKMLDAYGWTLMRDYIRDFRPQKSFNNFIALHAYMPYKNIRWDEGGWIKSKE